MPPARIPPLNVVLSVREISNVPVVECAADVSTFIVNNHNVVPIAMTTPAAQMELMDVLLAFRKEMELRFVYPHRNAGPLAIITISVIATIRDVLRAALQDNAFTRAPSVQLVSVLSMP